MQVFGWGQGPCSSAKCPQLGDPDAQGRVRRSTSGGQGVLPPLGPGSLSSLSVPLRYVGTVCTHPAHLPHLCGSSSWHRTTGDPGRPHHPGVASQPEVEERGTGAAGDPRRGRPPRWGGLRAQEPGPRGRNGGHIAHGIRATRASPPSHVLTSPALSHLSWFSVPCPLLSNPYSPASPILGCRQHSLFSPALGPLDQVRT